MNASANEDTLESQVLQLCEVGLCIAKVYSDVSLQGLLFFNHS